MSDKNQEWHFKSKKNRYQEQLLFHPPKHTQEETNLIITRLKRMKIRKVVEFGSGNGRLTIPLLQNHIQVLAVDISRESLIHLKMVASQVGVQKEVLQTSLLIPQAKTDAFVGCDILHHVNLDAYLKEMRSKLNKPGIIIFSEPNILNIAWTLLITFYIDWRIEWRIIYCNYFTLLKKLRQNNYKNINIKGVGILPTPLFNSFPTLQKLNYFLGNLPVLKLFAYRYNIFATGEE